MADIAVFLSPADLRPIVDDWTGTVHADARRADLCAADAAALEHGLRIADAWGGRVLAAAIGPETVEPVLVEARALGADVIRVDDGTHEAGPRALTGAELAGDPDTAAGMLAAVIGRPTVVVCGDGSDVPAFLAHRLGLASALGLVSVAIAGPGRLIVERRLDGGWRERLEVTGPAVLSVEGAGVRLRRASLAAVLEAGSTPIDVVRGHYRPGSAMAAGAPRPYRPRTRPVAPPSGGVHDRLLALTGALSNREPPRIIGPLGPAEAADELLSYLERTEGPRQLAAEL